MRYQQQSRRGPKGNPLWKIKFRFFFKSFAHREAPTWIGAFGIFSRMAVDGHPRAFNVCVLTPIDLSSHENAIVYRRAFSILPPEIRNFQRDFRARSTVTRRQTGVSRTSRESYHRFSDVHKNSRRPGIYSVLDISRGSLRSARSVSWIFIEAIPISSALHGVWELLGIALHRRHYLTSSPLPPRIFLSITDYTCRRIPRSFAHFYDAFTREPLLFIISNYSFEEAHGANIKLLDRSHRLASTRAVH